MSVDAKLSELVSKLKQIRRVKAGDYVLSTDHNYIVDALTIVRDTIELMKDKVSELEEKIEKYRVNVYPIVRRPLSMQSIDVDVLGTASLMVSPIDISVDVDPIASLKLASQSYDPTYVEPLVKREKAEQTYSSSVEAQVTKS